MSRSHRSARGSHRRLPAAPALLTAVCLAACGSGAAVVSAQPGHTVHAPEPVDWEMVGRIRAEAFERSEVMEIVRQLTEDIGPRLTGSPGMREANEWTRDQMAEWGLTNAQVEAWGEFGRGWSFERASVHLVEPFAMPLIALPEAWTPGTGGPVRGEAVRVSIESMDDLDAYRGRLAGKILLVDSPREPTDWDERPVIRRFDDDGLLEVAEYKIPGDRSERAGRIARYLKQWKLREALPAFLSEEGVVATLEVSSRDAGIVRVGGGGSREVGEDPGVTGLGVGAEHYNRLWRMARDAERNEPEAEEDEDGEVEDTETDGESAEDAEESGAEEAEEGADEASSEAEEDSPVLLEIDVAARFHDDDLQGYNTFADLPGTDLADEIVLVGGHLDSWHGSTGATDNAAGSAVAMEAVRILKALGVQPRRTVRVALWSGEEQGLLGSEAWTDEHLGSYPEPEGDEAELPRWAREPKGELTPGPLFDRVSAYFNLDNGGGKVRGVYTQSNLAVAPIFRAWLEPLRDLGATTVTHNDTGSTDHVAFDRRGVPGFQFIQDGLDYFSMTHHSNVDGFDHLSREDLMQASAVVATFVYHAAMRDERLPRKPLPTDR